jgi:hypothetical protein
MIKSDKDIPLQYILFSTSHLLFYNVLILLVEWLTNKYPCQKFLTFMTRRPVQVKMFECPNTYIPARRAYRDICTCSWWGNACCIAGGGDNMLWYQQNQEEFSADIKIDKGTGDYVQPS